jgi:ankyrin repeat protein
LINAIRKRSTLVNALLHLDFPLEHVDASGDTALSWAAYLDQPLTVMMLCSKGANVNHRNNKGSTPLLEACRNHSLDSARLLVSCGADVHTKDLDGRDCAFYRGTSIWEQLSQTGTLHLREETQPRPGDP